MSETSLGEFDLIRDFFDRSELRSKRSDVVGIGDDCALLSVPEGFQLAQSLDTLVEGVHFPVDCDPFYLGYRSLAVNLSDLAAMGATPHSFTLGLTLPEADPKWLKAFSDGLAALAGQYDAGLIGGDTTKGPLTISIQAQGFVKSGKALRRNGAKVGDLIYVSGNLGDAGGALPDVLDGKIPETAQDKSSEYLLNRYFKPSPRVELGQWLVENGATSALDISDGVLGDLGHILKASGVGAELTIAYAPVSGALLEKVGSEQALKLALTGGDDYELCFTWPESRVKPLAEELAEICQLTCIGRIVEGSGLVDIATGEPLSPKAYRHF
ncbi:thiamine-phosphate kinase [Endozoicomonas sp. OPT23]|uniref:thiamine-phosphate kinase n=1 Tax=Endozoicomonas sp. OPT23 TaxID=2072845 RepID=UPI00129BD91E|nr:thiamine-phosphate kinase [Endozoicomonas sp. OPT23]MRI32805.1 thiamine-phosphate kinase [Endozoicomonas sp. OPT23]